MHESSDPYLYLEDVTGDAALDWARERNAATFAELTTGQRYAALHAEVRDALDTDDRIPYPRRRGDHLYNFWRDAEHPRGLWRRTTPERYREDAPKWEVLLDVDALAADEDESWVWQGATVLRPGSYGPGRDRALVELSRGGADAAVVREFDIERREFVAEGFTVPEAKTGIGWIDPDHVYVGTDFGPGTLTDSGYPRIVRRWRRGTPLSAAETVFKGERTDVLASVTHDPTPGHERTVATRALDFYRSRRYLLGRDGERTAIDVPDDAEISLHREWMLVYPRTPWTVGGAEHPAGSLLAFALADFLAGGRDPSVLFTPTADTSLEDWAWTRGHLLLTTLTDVTPRLRMLTPGRSGWDERDLATAATAAGTAGIVGTDPDGGDDYFADSSGFLTPATLWHGTAGGGEPEPVKSAPELFDAHGLAVSQSFATSADGTRIPYFLVRAKGAEPGPTLLTGYGGFEISLTPYYSGVTGRGWLARGGTLAVANLRGGGEYGPQWHTGATGARRHVVYEDFAAVATDLVERGVTTARQLGIQGGSNGGLLMGVMLTRYPELFGAIVCQVPLLDMRRYHLLLAGASWMAEYGNPDDPEQWAWLEDFSPYQNLARDADYPPLLVTTSTRDDRVHPGHARKLVARMREFGHDVRYYENIEGGHGGAADNAQLATKWALAYEFLWRTLSPDRAASA